MAKSGLSMGLSARNTSDGGGLLGSNRRVKKRGRTDGRPGKWIGIKKEERDREGSWISIREGQPGVWPYTYMMSSMIFDLIKD